MSICPKGEWMLRRRVIQLGVLLCLIVLGISTPLRAASMPSGAGLILPYTERLGSRLAFPVSTPVSPGLLSETSLFYFPFIFVSEILPPVELSNAWTGDTDGSEKYAFLPGNSVRYFTSGINNTNDTAPVGINWSQVGSCGTTRIYSDTLNLEPGAWEHSYPSLVPNCQGIYTNTVQITYVSQTSTLTTLFVVNTPSTVVVNTRQAFDKCNLPPVELMQTWWDNSPYSVVNVYLGGISLGCSNDRLDPFWIHKVAQQGWSFIPTWVGPQAPCSGFTHRISSDAPTAYQEGRSEAEAASEAATLLGLMGERVIYYDVEGYYGASMACRSSVASFLQGWVERLHELGGNAGAYGSPCNSYIADWAGNTPAPDDIWIAHWYADSYDPDASVWDTPCLSNALWVNGQRIKQYTGDHRETWGGLSLTIDSDVLEGEVTALEGNPAALVEPSGPNTPAAIAPQIRDMGLLSPGQGWVLVDNRLLWAHDGGLLWQDITPNSEVPAAILAVTFLDRRLGWLVRRSTRTGEDTELTVLRTVDGGATWQIYPLPIPTSGNALPIGDAFLDFINAETGWIAFKLQTSSSFSLGRLLATRDGGRNWQERSIPLGERVRFVNAKRGWIAGGPSGDQLYGTNDGGHSWQLQRLPTSPSLSSGQAFVDLPVFENEQYGILPVTLSRSPNPRLALYATNDGGDTWGLATSMKLDLASEPAGPIPFSLTEGGRWWIASPEPERLYASPSPTQTATPLSPTGLPLGVIALDFLSGQIGWATVQDGTCLGNKPPAGKNIPTSLEPFRCEMVTRLFMTSDGGHTWGEITPPF